MAYYMLEQESYFIEDFKKAKSRKSYCTTPGVTVGGGVRISKKFNVKVFYVMGKALSGKLSCPCDRSCYFYHLSIVSLSVCESINETFYFLNLQIVQILFVSLI